MDYKSQLLTKEWTTTKKKVTEMLGEFMGVWCDSVIIPYSISSMYNSCYGFYNINIGYDRIEFFISLLHKYNLQTYASLVTYHHNYNWVGYDGGSLYTQGEYLSFNVWLYDEEEQSKPIDEKRITGIRDVYVECLKRFGVSAGHFMWRNLSVGLTKEHIEVNGDTIKTLPTQSSEHINHHIVACNIKGSHTICVSQFGKAELAKDFSSLEVLLSIFSPTSSISKVFKFFKRPDDTKCSYCVFLNDGSFIDQDFSNYIADNFRSPKYASKEINNNNNASEIEKIEKQIEKLVNKLAKLKNKAINKTKQQ
ncbi:MAG: DUF1542 domain-containing protein [Bacteroidales bacterium]